LDEWERLLMADEYVKQQIVGGKFARSDICLQLTLRSDTGNIALDLLPAFNFVKRKLYPRRIRRNKLITIQAETVKGLMNKDNHSQYSSSLSESQVGFIKQQHEFAHQVSKL